ncbi:hypothetical protein [Pseudobutyrivibrio sp.]|uniref:hypothetical protein n=1 Tax=Pseudobutyrivibrio sp. TaxID=2014367 RepID=UPI003866274A
MKKILTKITKSIVFIALLAVVLYEVNEILVPKNNHLTTIWSSTDRYNQFYNMEKNTVDVIFLGSSVVANAMSPQEIYDDYGIRSYNLASSGQSIFFNYYWLKEALKYQSPKVVVLDSKFIFSVYPDSAVNTTEGTYRECANSMKWSPNKVEMINELCKNDPSQDKLSYYLTNLRYHTRWAEIQDIDMNAELTSQDELKGQSIITNLGDAGYDVFVSSDTSIKADPVPLMEEYLTKIVDLCKENNIQLVLVTYPDITMTDAVNNRMVYYSEAYGVPYYNFCSVEHYYEIGAQLPKENVIEHENIWGAIKMSQYMGGILQKDFGVQPVQDEQWSSTSYYYHHMIGSADLSYINNIDEYLKTLAGDPQYITFISVKDDAVRFITDEDIALLNELGLKAPFKDMFRYSYCAVIDNNEGAFEEKSADEQITINGSLDEGKLIYEVTSGGTNAGIACSIVINGENYEANGVGFNFVVYDRVTQTVVDSVCFYRNEDGEYCKR